MSHVGLWHKCEVPQRPLCRRDGEKSGSDSENVKLTRLTRSGLSTLPYKTYCLRGFVTGQRRLGVITVLGVEVAEVHRDASAP
jgi:hypothetical protein